MKKIFGMRKHRDSDRELDKRYRDEMEEYEDDYYEDDHSDEGYEDDYSDEDYSDEEYSDEDYAEDDDFYAEDDDFVDLDEEYDEAEDEVVDEAEAEPEYEAEKYDEDSRSSDVDEYVEFYEEDEYPEETDGEEADEDYREDDRDYVEDEEYYEEDYNRDDDREYKDEYYEDDYRDEEDYDDYEDDYRDNRRGGRGSDRRDRDYDRDDYRDNRRNREYDRCDRRSRRGRDDDEESVGQKIIAFLGKTTAVERIAAVFALLILAGGIATASFYATAMKGNKQLENFGEIGTSLADTEIIGQSGLLAMADAEKAKAMAAQIVTPEVEEEEQEVEVADDAENVTIKMTVTSIKSDIKVKFINSATGKLVANLPLEIEVVGPDGNTVTYNDHDQDGIIYKKDITKGDYKITPKPLGSGYEKYKLELTSKTVTVKDTVEMKAVDVSNEVKKESQVNVAKEDTQVKAEVESVLQDTVEWVESTKTPIGENSDGSFSYEEVKKDTIPNPASSAMVGTRRWMLLEAGAASSLTSIGDEETAKAPGAGEGSTDESGKDASKEPETKEKDKIKLSANTDMTEGDTQEVSISGTEASVTLESSDSSVVSVSGKTIKAEKEGTATITASGDNCESAELKIKVKAKEKEKENFSVHNTTINIKVDESKSIGASASSSISYKSNDENIAKVDGSGNVKGVKEGSTTITLTADGYNDGTVYVTVAKADAKTMTVEPASVSVKEGEEVQIKVTGPEAGKIKFESADKNIATVGETDGKVKGVKEGKTSVKITSDGYQDVTVNVSVAKADAKTMTVEPASVKVMITDEATIKVTGPEAGKVKFESADKNIATVGETDGKVKGVSVGKTTIKITSEGYTDVSINVEVIAKDGVVPMSISKITIVEGQSIKVSAKDANTAIELESENSNIAAVSDKTTITGKAAGDIKVKVKAQGYSENSIAVKVVAKSTVLKDKDGNEIYIQKNDGSFDRATYEDYYTRDKFYLKKPSMNYKYTGWQTLDGKTYFFDKDGNKIIGEQVIQHAKYTFGADGVLVQTPGAMGIDVSKWNGNIDWAAVKNSGVSFAIIRCGYRGSSEGALIEDQKFRSNIKGALNAGLKVGVYFFTQAVNEVEAVEEASMVINLVNGYGLSFPIYLDVEGSGGRGDAINAGQRTANIKAFCGTIQNAGYKAGVYANKTWLTSRINTSQITNYKIWLAQYAQAVTYSGSRYDMWQYTSKGRITGISGYVDMNICY